MSNKSKKGFGANKFFVSELRQGPSSLDIISSNMYGQMDNSVEITLKSLDWDSQSMRKLQFILEDQRIVTINDSHHNDYIEPFKDEFIEFMM